MNGGEGQKAKERSFKLRHFPHKDQVDWGQRTCEWKWLLLLSFGSSPLAKACFLNSLLYKWRNGTDLPTYLILWHLSLGLKSTVQKSYATPRNPSVRGEGGTSFCKNSYSGSERTSRLRIRTHKEVSVSRREDQAKEAGFVGFTTSLLR